MRRCPPAERIGLSRQVLALNMHQVLLLSEDILQQTVRYGKAIGVVHTFHLHVAEEILAFHLTAHPIP